MAAPSWSRHVEKVVGYLPPRDMAGHQRRAFHEALPEALLDAHGFEHLPGKWQAAVGAEPARPSDRQERARPDQ